MSCARANILRKQKSCISDLSSGIKCRERRFQLQKQFSIDQSRDVISVGNQRSTAITGQSKNNNHQTNAWCGNDRSPEASLRIFTAFKNNYNENGNCVNTEKLAENSTNKKAMVRNDEKININIFLGHNAHVPELEIPSDSECGNIDTTTKWRNNNNSIRDQMKTAPKMATENKRYQFQTQRSASVGDARPKLLRAMSAPIRPSTVDQQTTQLNQSKKRLRRKKIAPMETEQYDFKLVQQQQRKIFLEKNTVGQANGRPSTSRSKVKPPKCAANTIARTRSGFNGFDIVTLVSLLSPGGSDSEKEDVSSTTCDNNENSSGNRAPSLRKCGKSVSFQEDEDIPDDSPTIEFPTVFRQASLAPLAAKIRLNRPPTAPAGSIYMNNIQSLISSVDGMSSSQTAIDLDAIDQSATPSSTQHIEFKSAITTTTVTRKTQIEAFDSITAYPEYVRSIKEKECWLLFQKMVNKGISVSYETIMRGMLTPTEVRAVEKKQKEIVERQASIDLEAAAAAAAVECDKKSNVVKH